MNENGSNSFYLNDNNNYDLINSIDHILELYTCRQTKNVRTALHSIKSRTKDWEELLSA